MKKIVIAGAGEVGCHLAKMLSESDFDITIIDSDPERLVPVSESMDVITIQGKPTSIEILKKAKVDEADLFVSVCPAKEQDVNLISAILAKQLGARKVTARINEAEYLDYENKLIFTDLGIDSLFYPERNAANEILGLIQESEMAEFTNFCYGRLRLVVFRLDKYSKLIDRSFGEFRKEKSDRPFKILAISREDETIIPDDEDHFREKDRLYILVGSEYVDHLMKYSGKEDIDIKRMTILGGGRIGEMVAREFEKKADFTKIIEINRERCEYLSETLSNTLVINGDGRNSDFIYEEDVKGCDAFVAVTSSSETNIMACVAAKKMGIAKTIAEVENIEYIRLAEEMGIDSVVNKKLITAGRIYGYTMGSTVRTIKCLSGTEAYVVEYNIAPGVKVTSAPIKELKIPSGAVIGGIIRGEETIIPDASTRIKPYDKVVVFALPSAMGRVERLFS